LARGHRRRQQPVALAKSEKVLEGFCREPHPEERIALNSKGLMLFPRLADIEWLETVGPSVVLHVGKETHVLAGTLAAVAAKLPARRFLRASPSVLVNGWQIRKLRSALHGQCELLLRSGTRLPLVCPGCVLANTRACPSVMLRETSGN
jgi:DNA-binding LytR/AlgR family response regulator